jgi:hypothetical protein
MYCTQFYWAKPRRFKFLYSITRADGYNTQERAKAKAEKYSSYAASAEKKSTEYYEASHEGRDFLALGEPIKVGHHSETTQGVNRKEPQPNE